MEQQTANTQESLEFETYYSDQQVKPQWNCQKLERLKRQMVKKSESHKAKKQKQLA
jgi:hypothetical protein